MITILDYGMGNLGSVSNMLKKIGVRCIITSDPEEIRTAEKLILPGVGAFDTAIKKIEQLGIKDLILELAIEKKIPVLGICLGMQLLLDQSEEGTLPGLGLIKGKALHFKNYLRADYKIPHMGWNEVTLSNSCILTEGFNEEFRFYFVHSYFVRVEESINSMMQCNYGVLFDAAIKNGNIYGAQFHPEKSHRFGMRFLENFAKI